MDENKHTLFIVDDDASVRKSLTRLLCAHAYQVESFESAEAYLARENYPGVGAIILDLTMPGLNGMDLQTRLLEQGSSLPIVFLTAHGDIPTSVKAMKLGAKNFLTKPVDEAELIPAVTEAVSHHAEIQQQQNKQLAIQQKIKTLTQREYQILRYVISGALNKQIAQELQIAEKTVKVHRAHMLEKMAAGSVAELVHKCDLINLQPLQITPSHQFASSNE